MKCARCSLLTLSFLSFWCTFDLSIFSVTALCLFSIFRLKLYCAEVLVAHICKKIVFKGSICIVCMSVCVCLCLVENLVQNIAAERIDYYFFHICFLFSIFFNSNMLTVSVLDKNRTADPLEMSYLLGIAGGCLMAFLLLFCLCMYAFRARKCCFKGKVATVVLSHRESRCRKMYWIVIYFSQLIFSFYLLSHCRRTRYL